MPLPGTLIWTCGWRGIVELQLCKTAADPFGKMML